MTRQEFLSELSGALQGEVPQSVIREQLNFYESYIDTQISCGKTEEQIFEELGSPRLIARTIIDSTEAGEEKNSGSYQSSGGYYEAGPGGQSAQNENKNSQLPSIVLVLILVLLLVICVLGTIFKFLFSPFGLVFILFVLVYFWYASRRR